MKYLLYLICLIYFTISLNAQYNECDSVFFESVFESQDLNNFCELNTGMPFEIMLPYIVFDSVCSQADYNNWEQFLSNQTSMNDTIRSIMKYFYKLVDYDPLLFDKNLRYIFLDFAIHPISVYLDFRKKITEVSSSPMLDRALLYSYYILKVQVDDIQSKVRPNSITGNTLTFATCTITDTIKGKIGPFCSSSISSQNKVNSANVISTVPLDSTAEINIGSFIEFVYSPDWTIGKNSDFEIRDTSGINQSGILDSLGNSWLKPGEEYLIFLESFEVCRDSSTFFTILKPLALESKTFTMYPIKSNGTVYNPGNDFGLGNISYSAFVNAIRDRISFIKNFGG